jgi:hypothetical protein
MVAGTREGGEVSMNVTAPSGRTGGRTCCHATGRIMKLCPPSGMVVTGTCWTSSRCKLTTCMVQQRSCSGMSPHPHGSSAVACMTATVVSPPQVCTRISGPALTRRYTHRKANVLKFFTLQYEKSAAKIKDRSEVLELGRFPARTGGSQAAAGKLRPGVYAPHGKTAWRAWYDAAAGTTIGGGT